MSSDGVHFYYGRLQVDAFDITNNLNVFPEFIRAANHAFAIGRTGVYDVATAALVLEHEAPVSAAFAADEGGHLWMVTDNILRHFVTTDRAPGVIRGSAKFVVCCGRQQAAAPFFLGKPIRVDLGTGRPTGIWLQSGT